MSKKKTKSILAELFDADFLEDLEPWEVEYFTEYPALKKALDANRDTFKQAKAASKLPRLIQDELIVLQIKAEKLNQKRKDLIRETCKNCKHPAEAVRERPYKSDPYGHRHQPSWLICTECGLTEQGWYCGYNILKHAEYTDPPEINDDDWFEMRTLMIDNKGKRSL